MNDDRFLGRAPLAGPTPLSAGGPPSASWRLCHTNAGLHFEVKELRTMSFACARVLGQALAARMSTDLRQRAADCYRAATTEADDSLLAEATLLEQQAERRECQVVSEFVRQWFAQLPSLVKESAEILGLDARASMRLNSDGTFPDEEEPVIFDIVGWHYQVPREDIERREAIYREAKAIARKLVEIRTCRRCGAPWAEHEELRLERKEKP